MSLVNTILHLSLINNVGPATIEKLVQALTLKQLEEIYNYSIVGLSQAINVSIKLATIIVNGLKDKDVLSKELDLAKKHNIRLLSVFDEEYPSDLKNIHLPPPIIYVRGNIGLVSDHVKRLAIVGSRKADNYGQKVIEALVPDLIKQNWTLVSGGALGIDSMVHRETLKNNGSTIAVLGSGLLNIYPSANKKLFDNIADFNGAIISSFSLMQSPMAGNFPARNRIISGLSKGCLVVQAAKRSGALITANYSLEQGREVFAVPGNIFNDLSTGCNYLISQGAIVVNSVNDLLDNLGRENINFVQSSNKSDSIIDNSISIDTNTKDLQIKKEVSDNLNILSMSVSDKVLYYASEEISFDELMAKANIGYDELGKILWDLQIEAKIQQNFAGLWKAI